MSDPSPPLIGRAKEVAAAFLVIQAQDGVPRDMWPTIQEMGEELHDNPDLMVGVLMTLAGAGLLLEKILCELPGGPERGLLARVVGEPKAS